MTMTIRTIQQLSLASMMLIGAKTLEGQACIGLPNLAMAPRTVSTTGEGTDLGRTLVVRYGIAGQRVFGGAQAGYAGDKFAKPRAPIYGADVGFVLPLGASGATQLCPVLQSVYQHGPNGSAFSRNRLASSFSVSLGRAIGVSQSVAVVPSPSAFLGSLSFEFATRDRSDGALSSCFLRLACFGAARRAGTPSPARPWSRASRALDGSAECLWFGEDKGKVVLRQRFNALSTEVF